MGQLSNPCKRRLDYGCGKGYDADALGMFKYDPHFAREEPAGKFDRIYCGYVLNVLDKKEGQEVVDKIKSLLTPGGTAYIVVRRDMKKGSPNQRKVVLKGDTYTLHDNSKYAIYTLYSDSEVKVK